MAAGGVDPVNDHRAIWGEHDIVGVEIAVQQLIFHWQGVQVPEDFVSGLAVQQLYPADLVGQPLDDRFQPGCLTFVHLQMQVGQLAHHAWEFEQVLLEAAQHRLALYPLVDDPRPAIDLDDLADLGYPVAGLLAGESLLVLEFGRPARPALAVEFEDLILAPGEDLGGAPVGEFGAGLGRSGHNLLILGEKIGCGNLIFPLTSIT